MTNVVVGCLTCRVLVMINLIIQTPKLAPSGYILYGADAFHSSAFTFGISEQNSAIQSFQSVQERFNRRSAKGFVLQRRIGVDTVIRDVKKIRLKRCAQNYSSKSIEMDFESNREPRQMMRSSDAIFQPIGSSSHNNQQRAATSTDAIADSDEDRKRLNCVKKVPLDQPVALKHLEFTAEDVEMHNHYPPVIILHGLLGSKRNFVSLGNSLSQQLQQKRRIIAVDLRNHGDNHHDWRTSMRYEDMVSDVLAFLDEQGIEKAVLVGHSMGGKVAQATALLYPHRVAGLVVIDIAPVTYSIDRDGGWKAVCQILDALRGLQNLSEMGFTTKKQVDQALREAGVDDPALRAFVLTNVEMERDNGKGKEKTLQWKVFLEAILNEIESLAGFIDDGQTETQETSKTSPPFQYRGDTFLISGGASRFVRVSHMETISKFFPNHMLTTVRGAGHWVHAEAPDDTLALLRRYLDR